MLPGVGKPQDIAIAPNGRVFVAEKTGFIRTYDSVDDTTPTLFADLRTQVHNYGSRGLLSIVADPGIPGQAVRVRLLHDGRAARRHAAGVRRRLLRRVPEVRRPAGRGPRQGRRADDRPGRQLPGGLAHLAAPGRGRGDDRLREGAGRGLLPAVRRPRGRRPRIRQGRQADRLGKRRLHLAVLGLGSVGIAGRTRAATRPGASARRSRARRRRAAGCALRTSARPATRRASPAR